MSHTLLVAQLSLVPGIGPKSVEKLQAKGVKNTFNLVGQFLTMFDEERSTQENCVSIHKIADSVAAVHTWWPIAQ